MKKTAGNNRSKREVPPVDRHRKIVEIEWVDSCGLIPVWEVIDRNLLSLAPWPRWTVGYLWEETENYITVAQSWNEESVGRRFSIPRGCIVKMQTIRR
jgi:hypothetical protein